MVFTIVFLFELDISAENRYNTQWWKYPDTCKTVYGGRCGMKRDKGDNRIVYQSLAMITQFGLNMIVPICAMSALGVWLDGKLGTSWLTILFFAVGAVAGGQNVYRMARHMCGEEAQDKGQGGSDEDI